MNMEYKVYLLTLAVLAFAATASAQVASKADSDTTVNRTVKLDEVEVKAALVKHDARSDEYIMTQKLTRGTGSVYDVLSRLPGVSYNNLTSKLSVRMDERVLITVDGKLVNEEYVRAIPVNRIARIQMVYVPSARYTSQGIRYVVNVKLRNDYVGHDLYLGNFTMLSAGDNNGDDIVANEQPKMQYIYSGKKVDFTAGYGFADINWNYPISYTKDYTGIASIASGDVSAKDPNDHNSTLTHYANLGFDWQPAPYQTLSLRGYYQNDNLKHRTTYDITEKLTAQGSNDSYTEQSRTHSKAGNGGGAIYYQGMFRSGWTIYSSLGYIATRDKYDVDYSGGSYTSAGLYRNGKDNFKGELDLTYNFTDAMSLNFGYRAVWNRYTTCDRESDDMLMKNLEWRHTGYAFLDWMPKQTLLLHVGTSLENIHKNGLSDSRDWFEVLPKLTATWQPSEKVQLLAEYTTSMQHPSLYEVSNTPSAVDQWLVQSGYDKLAPSRTQLVSLQGTFLNSLILGVEYSHTHDAITTWYEQTGDNSFRQTLTNARGQQFRVVGAYNWEITKGLTWNNILQAQWQEMSGRGLSNHYWNFSAQSSVEYWLKPWQMLMKGEYHREMQKLPLLQGWQEYGQDLWQFTLQKNFLKNRLAVSLSYVPPIHWGAREDQRQEVKTSFMNYNQNLNLKTYDNLLLLRVQWRFNKGRKKQRRVQQYEFNTEKREDRGLM